MYHVPLPFQYVNGCSYKKKGKWENVRLPGFLYAYDLVLYGKPDEDLRIMVKSVRRALVHKGQKWGTREE